MSTSEALDVVVPGPARSLRGTAAATTVLAAALLMGIGLGPAVAASAAAPAGAVTAAAASSVVDPDVAQRLVGVAQDLAEAVIHGEITAEQAECFLQQVHRRLAC
ncbi:hypothetical protein [Kocuria sabuli]|uniref:hypothetical protein n=1 Tax=Kocuria sabuli TaxID=3071448 RepID=UPI0034D6BB26